MATRIFVEVVTNPYQVSSSVPYGYYQTCLQGYKDCGLDTRVLEKALKESVQLAREQTRRAQEVQATQAVQQPNEIQETQEPVEQMQFV